MNKKTKTVSMRITRKQEIIMDYLTHDLGFGTRTEMINDVLGRYYDKHCSLKGLDPDKNIMIIEGNGKQFETVRMMELAQNGIDESSGRKYGSAVRKDNKQ